MFVVPIYHLVWSAFLLLLARPKFVESGDSSSSSSTSTNGDNSDDEKKDFLGARPVVAGVNAVTADSVVFKNLKNTTKYNVGCGGHVWAEVLSYATRNISLAKPLANSLQL